MAGAAGFVCAGVVFVGGKCAGYFLMNYWKRYQLLSREKLPTCAGVYAIYFDDELVYVGQSSNIANRFTEHKFRYGYGREIITPWADIPAATKVFVKVKKSRARGDWAMWEIRLIHRLQPRFNRQHRRRGLA